MTLTGAIRLWGATVFIALFLLGLLFYLHGQATVALVLFAFASLFLLLVWIFGGALKPWG